MCTAPGGGVSTEGWLRVKEVVAFLAPASWPPGPAHSGQSSGLNFMHNEEPPEPGAGLRVQSANKQVQPLWFSHRGGGGCGGQELQGRTSARSLCVCGAAGRKVGGSMCKLLSGPGWTLNTPHPHRNFFPYLWNSSRNHVTESIVKSTLDRHQARVGLRAG